MSDRLETQSPTGYLRRETIDLNKYPPSARVIALLRSLNFCSSKETLQESADRFIDHIVGRLTLPPRQQERFLPGEESLFEIYLNTLKEAGYPLPKINDDDVNSGNEEALSESLAAPFKKVLLDYEKLDQEIKSQLVNDYPDW